MKRTLQRILVLAAMSTAASWAGALLLEVANPEVNPEAKSMNAALVATSTACHEPAKSMVTATSVQWQDGEMRRTSLRVVALKTPGSFAVIGAVPPGSLVDLAVSNPEYKDYRPRVLIRSDSHGLQWSSARRFFGSPPSDSDFKSMIAQAD